ncbi:SpaH/EbpB family LPXTG-anchored major pilin [Clostridium perfringens]|uniref:SpaH/EbpB family LPXTG-anchored major pilin n=1 Tax=Clostridium perfringens TaxID=1502 RepID=UPI001313F1FC|nr:SpaH/EbpB family LPXTG-anchored major pilin [Clostridium perfringens]
MKKYLSIILCLMFSLISAVPTFATTNNEYHAYSTMDGQIFVIEGNSDEIAYCYQKEKLQPPLKKEDISDLPIYEKESYQMNDLLNKQIAAILYSGYPIDSYKKINELGININQAIRQTQNALWAVIAGDFELTNVNRGEGVYYDFLIKQAQNDLIQNTAINKLNVYYYNHKLKDKFDINRQDLIRATLKSNEDQENTKNGSITVKNENATFNGYKILDATQSGDAFIYTPTKDFENFFNNDQYGNYDVAKIKDLTSDETKIFAAELHKYVIDQNINNVINIDGNVKTTVDLGYYLVLETTEASQGAAVVSTAMLTPVPKKENDNWQYDVILVPKDSSPTLEKKIVIDNQKTDTSTANIGDIIKYEVNAIIPTYEPNAQNIVYKFNDTMSKGLTYDEESGFIITSGDKTFIKGQDYTITQTKSENGETNIEVSFKYESIKAYSTLPITLKYQAILNENAIVNPEITDGNTNKVTLTYTNNPDLESNYKVLEDKVTTYTWGFGVKKVDSENISIDLAGAAFSVRDKNGNVIGKYTYDSTGNVVLLKGKGVTDKNGRVIFTGLKEGDYFIKEEKAPKGYSLLKEPVKVTITAQKDDNGEYTGQATISVTNGNEAGSIINNITMNDGNVLFNVQIKNYAGISLPGTGGIGTDGFIKIGLVLLGVVIILGAGYVVLDKRKRI